MNEGGNEGVWFDDPDVDEVDGCDETTGAGDDRFAESFDGGGVDDDEEDEGFWNILRMSFLSSLGALEAGGGVGLADDDDAAAPAVEPAGATDDEALVVPLGCCAGTDPNDLTTSDFTEAAVGGETAGDGDEEMGAEASLMDPNVTGVAVVFTVRGTATPSFTETP
jgi:hypothetical protein